MYKAEKRTKEMNMHSSTPPLAAYMERKKKKERKKEGEKSREGRDGKRKKRGIKWLKSRQKEK
jgi:hypothetical protein